MAGRKHKAVDQSQFMTKLALDVAIFPSKQTASDARGPQEAIRGPKGRPVFS
jgi:hypothetical protein